MVIFSKDKCGETDKGFSRETMEDNNNNNKNKLTASRPKPKEMLQRRQALGKQEPQECGSSPEKANALHSNFTGAGYRHISVTERVCQNSQDYAQKDTFFTSAFVKERLK